MGNEAKNRVLAVNDKEENLKLLQAIAESGGYEVVLARNGLEALEQLKKIPIDLIISDILMPEMDGFQLCRKCKADEKLCKIPFIINTATYVDEKDEEFSLRLGAARFITEPIEPKEFLKIIDEVLKKGKRGAVSVAKETVEEEVVYLKEYNERLIQKLEDKNEQLQKELAERRKIESAIRESEGKLRYILENIQDVVFQLSPLGFITYVSPKVEGLYGYKPEDLIGQHLKKTTPLSEIPKALGLLQRVLSGETVKNFELNQVDNKGNIVYMDLNVTPLKKEDKIIGIQGVMRDITERKQMEETLRQNENYLKTIFNFVQTGVMIIDAETHLIVDVNPVIIKAFGAPKEQIVGTLCHQYICPAEKGKCPITDLGQTADNAERVLVKANGERIPVLKTVVPIIINNHKFLLESFVDITERKKTEEALLHAAQEWRTTFDSIFDMVSIHDKNYKIIRVNKAFADRFKMKPQDVIGKTCYELVHGTKEPPAGCPHRRTLETKKPEKGEYFEPNLNLYLEVSTSPIFDEKGELFGSVHVARDVTMRKNLEKTQRLTELGKLVADMAHEVNNPLMIISGNAQLSLLEGTTNEEIKGNLKIVQEECNRAKDIIQRLLKFSRPSKGVCKEMDIHQSIESVVNLIEHQFSLNNIEIKRNFMNSPPFIAIDEKQMQEVIVNLLNNARDAMPKGGTIEIKSSLKGNFMRIDIRDTGTGMDKETLSKLFEPFFTTKEKGTGLGLSVCYGIVKAHNGELKFESEPGKGTTATILLPVKPSEVKDNA